MADDRLESHPAEIVFVGNCAKLRLNEIAIGFFHRGIFQYRTFI